MASDSDGWDGILDPGETILWQGRPEARTDWSGLRDMRTLIGIAFAAFALFWMSKAAEATSAGAIGLVLPLFGLPFLWMGWQLAIGRHLRQARVLRGTHYTLTDRTAFVATENRGSRALQRYALAQGMPIALEEGDGTGTVWFHDQLIRHPERRVTTQGARGYSTRPAFTERQRVGFEHIPDARAVFGLLRDSIARLPAATEPPDGTP